MQKLANAIVTTCTLAVIVVVEKKSAYDIFLLSFVNIDYIINERDAS